MPLRKLEFENTSSHVLSAVLDRPADEKPTAYAVLAHCFTCSKDLSGLRSLSRALTRQGFAVLRFDFTGLGESGGEFPDTNFSSSIQDVVDAAGFLDREYEPPALLVGHSLGGAAVIRAAESVPSARAIATVGAPADPEHIRSNLVGDLKSIEEEGEGEIQIGGCSFTIQQQFLEDIQEQPMNEALRTLRRPLLIFHSPLDAVVGIENASRIFAAARHPKSFVSLDDADHLLTNRADAIFAGDVLGAWTRRYAAAQEDVKEGAPEDNRTIAYIGDELRTEMVVNGHPLVADEPSSIPGGGNSGPTPYDYLAAALASCTAMTLRMYADRKRWPLEEARITVEHSKIHAEDCAECEEKEGKLDQFVRTVRLTGALSDEEQKRLVEIANRCPVHRTLKEEVDISTEQADE